MREVALAANRVELVMNGQAERCEAQGDRGVQLSPHRHFNEARFMSRLGRSSDPFRENESSRKARDFTYLIINSSSHSRHRYSLSVTLLEHLLPSIIFHPPAHT